MYIFIDKAYKKELLIVICTFLYILFTGNNMTIFEEQILLFEIDEENEVFREIRDIDAPIHTLLFSSSIFIIVDPVDKEVFIWEGKKASVRKKFIATQNAPNIRDRYGVDFKIVTVDEGSEPSEFKDLVGL